MPMLPTAGEEIATLDFASRRREHYDNKQILAH